MKKCGIETMLKLISCFTFCISLTVSALNSDALSLLALKAAIWEDPQNAVVSWSESDSSPCRWGGIICNGTQHDRVTSISLSGKNLHGYIPSEIGALAFLAFLDLSHNSFSGPLPHQITNLDSLVHLDVSSNNFSGSLPQGFGNLKNLRGSLNLSYNAFSGVIPASFGRLPMMVSLDLRRNNLTGKIPQVGSLLNQGPTAFSGNPFLCGFPSNTLCAESNTGNPSVLNPQKPGISSNGLSADRKMKTGMVTVSVISGVSVAVLGMVFVSVWLMKRRWKTEGKMGRENVSMEAGGRGEKGKFVILEEGFGLELEDLLRASAYVLGKSRSGIVYKVVVSGGGKGVGPCRGLVAAVRRLSEGEASWRLKEFEAEVEAIAKVQHPNIVRMKAYYYATDEKLLISEYIGNGSLHHALHGSMNNIPPLSWNARLRIAQEVGRGLMHIHECSSTHRKHVHGSIKTSKILLDDELKPYISGFGLPLLVQGASRSSNAAPRKQSPSGAPKSSTPSTLVHLAPEARAAGSRFTQKCDVYSFGLVLLEILTGRVQDGMEGLVRKVFREERPLSEIIDPTLLHEVEAKKEVVAVFHIALRCTEMDPQLRPRMRTVCDSLDRIKLDL